MSRVDLLHNALEQALVAATVDAFASLVADKLAAKGISLTARERDQLALYISDDTGEAFSLRRWRWRESGSVTVEVTEAEAEAVHDRFQAFLDNHLQSLIHSSIED